MFDLLSIITHKNALFVREYTMKLKRNHLTKLQINIELGHLHTKLHVDAGRIRRRNKITIPETQIDQNQTNLFSSESKFFEMLSSGGAFIIHAMVCIRKLTLRACNVVLYFT